jgi:hypothetical protein
MFRFTIRDLLFVTALFAAALWICLVWHRDYERQRQTPKVFLGIDNAIRIRTLNDDAPLKASPDED